MKGDINKMDDFEKHLEKQLKNQDFKAEYEALEPEYMLREQIILARHDKKLTQKQLAELIGTKQSSISRFEKGTYTPDLDFMKKLAKGLDKKLYIELK